MKTPLRFAKIISTPTLHAWTQGYTAGNLIAIISLTQSSQNGTQEITEISLPILGKDLINTLEAEYFTLETKNLTTIKQAISTTIEKVPQDILLSFGVAVIIENILYLYQYGPGKIVMKRKDKIGVLLEQTEQKNLIAGSGFIEDGDVILLETQKFTETVPVDTISPYLHKDKISEMADKLSPLVHESQMGGAAAIAFSYSEDNSVATTQHGEKTIASDSFAMPEPPKEEKLHSHPHVSQNEPEVIPENQDIKPNEKNAELAIEDATIEEPKKRKFSSFHFSHARKLFITIVVILIVVLIGSIFFSTRKQKQVADQKLFTQTVVPAQKKYDEAQSLMSLNQNLAMEDYQSAKNLLTPAVGKFPADSKESLETTTLMQKIDTALSQIAQTAPQDAKQTDASNSPVLSALMQHANAKYATEDTKAIYLVDATGITSIDKSTAKTTAIITNNSDWKDVGGLATYLGNFYVLDRSGGILKYVPTGNGFSKSHYFPGNAPDVSKANGIAIDGSIWIISSDGSIAKYTRGIADTFTIKGIDKPLSNPTRIYTSIDSPNVYILDNGNKRIVVLDKKGNFIAQYPAGIINSAQDFQVFEPQKKVYVLSTSKVWEIDLK